MILQLKRTALGLAVIALFIGTIAAVIGILWLMWSLLGDRGLAVIGIAFAVAVVLWVAYDLGKDLMQ